MAAGCCFVLQRNLPEGTADPEFDDLVATEALFSIDREAGPEELASVLCDLARNKARRNEVARRLAESVKDKLHSWPTRIESEVRLLRDIVGFEA